MKKSFVILLSFLSFAFCNVFADDKPKDTDAFFLKGNVKTLSEAVVRLGSDEDTIFVKYEFSLEGKLLKIDDEEVDLERENGRLTSYGDLTILGNAVEFEYDEEGKLVGRDEIFNSSHEMEHYLDFNDKGWPTKSRGEVQIGSFEGFKEFETANTYMYGYIDENGNWTECHKRSWTEDERAMYIIIRKITYYDSETKQPPVEKPDYTTVYAPNRGVFNGISMANKIDVFIKEMHRLGMIGKETRDSLLTIDKSTFRKRWEDGSAAWISVPEISINDCKASCNIGINNRMQVCFLTLSFALKNEDEIAKVKKFEQTLNNQYQYIKGQEYSYGSTPSYYTTPWGKIEYNGISRSSTPNKAYATAFFSFEDEELVKHLGL